MSLLPVVLLFILGLVLIVKGGDYFVDAATWMAEVSGIPKFIVGATVVSVATTLPELIVSVMSALQGKVEMGIGNAVGSVTANTALIMGIALICIPFSINRKQYTTKMILLIVSAVLLPILCLSGSLNLGGAFLLLAVFMVYIIENIKSAKAQKSTTERPSVNKQVVTKNVFLFIIGAVGIVIGARLMVDNGAELARIIGIPESVIGLTVIAIGTSLPELVTMIVSVKKKQAALSVGNIIGANIIDLVSILPICAIVSGGSLPVARQSIMVDMPVCLLVILIAIVPTLIFGRFRRWQGALTIAIYLFYVVAIAF